MGPVETNPFICFVPRKPSVLILGSFPCFNKMDYGDWFYSGSGRNHFWPLLSDVFQMPASTRDEKEKLCERHGIALSDVAYRIRRKENNCSDSNLLILELNLKGVGTCLASGVKQVFCTSSFVLRHFARMFPACDLPVHLLLSPSPAANRHIGGLQEYKELLKNGKVGNPYEYRLFKYREILSEGKKRPRKRA